MVFALADTFTAHRRTGTVLLSSEGKLQTVLITDDAKRKAKMDENIDMLGQMIKLWLFNDLDSGVEEVDKGLLPLMEKDGYSVWPVIRDHSCLVPRLG